MALVLTDACLQMKLPPVVSELSVCLCLVEQVTNVVLYSNDKYVKSVAKEETE